MKSFDHVSICGCWGMPPELRCLSPVSFVPTIRCCVINSMCMWYHVYVSWICSHLTFCEKKTWLWRDAVESEPLPEIRRAFVSKKKRFGGCSGFWHVPEIRLYLATAKHRNVLILFCRRVLPTIVLRRNLRQRYRRRIEESKLENPIEYLLIMTSPFLSHPCEGNCNLLDSARLENSIFAYTFITRLLMITLHWTNKTVQASPTPQAMHVAPTIATGLETTRKQRRRAKSLHTWRCWKDHSLKGLVNDKDSSRSSNSIQNYSKRLQHRWIVQYARAAKRRVTHVSKYPQQTQNSSENGIGLLKLTQKNVQPALLRQFSWPGPGFRFQSSATATATTTNHAQKIR